MPGKHPYFTNKPSVILWELTNDNHYGDVIMGTMASQITSLTIVYSTVYSDADQRKHQSSASLAFVRGIHRGPVNSPYKWPVTRKMFPFDDVIMVTLVKKSQQVARGHYYYDRLTLIPAWISKHLCGSVEWISNFTTHFIMEAITYPSWD